MASLDSIDPKASRRLDVLLLIINKNHLRSLHMKALKEDPIRLRFGFLYPDLA